MEIFGFSPFGYEGELVKVEADLRRGIPAVEIVGLPDGAVREARERMRAAIRNSGLEFPRERILINLSPADLRKEGSGFDLPIALAVLAASGGTGVLSEADLGILIVGELELSGAVRPVRAVLAAVSQARERGIHYVMVPAGNREEAGIQSGCAVIAVTSLAEAVERMTELTRRPPSQGQLLTGYPISGTAHPENSGIRAAHWSAPDADTELSDIRGQNKLLRAMQVAAAGGHSLIAYGPPGCGKTLALRRFQSLLPDLDQGTALTVTRIHSIAGLLRERPISELLIRRPPLREPHQGASVEGITGGGRLCLPGEISLAHGGALFLDEAGQFKTSVLQALRVPLETGSVTVSRAGRISTYPSRFQLLLAVNPCPCGNYTAKDRVCTCTPEMIDQYWRKFSAPLLDRVDIRIPVQSPEPEELAGNATVDTAALRTAIALARNTQAKRLPAGTLNACLESADIGRYCKLTEETRSLFVRGARLSGISGRGAHSVLKVARTIADMEAEKEIGPYHIMEAFQLRRWQSGLPDFL